MTMPNKPEPPMNSKIRDEMLTIVLEAEIEAIESYDENGNMPPIISNKAVDRLLALFDTYAAKERLDELKHVFHVSHDNLGTTVKDPEEYQWVKDRINELHTLQSREQDKV